MIGREGLEKVNQSKYEYAKEVKWKWRLSED